MARYGSIVQENTDGDGSIGEWMESVGFIVAVVDVDDTTVESAGEWKPSQVFFSEVKPKLAESLYHPGT